ncbi:MAG: hypothetical protein V8S34_04585 [Lawsonibacter sp.]
MPVPVVVDGQELFRMSYQHDLIVESGGQLRAIGSVKTSSKDRLDKIFIDKFLYNKLTNADTPHFAIFLNDVQRKGREPHFGVNTTFLSGHFKGYTVKLNPLDGVSTATSAPTWRPTPSCPARSAPWTICSQRTSRNFCQITYKYHQT